MVFTSSSGFLPDSFGFFSFIGYRFLSLNMVCLAVFINHIFLRARRPI
jgi:hypothetical protein